MAGSTFEAVVNTRAIKLTLEKADVAIDGQRRSYSLRRTGRNSYSLLLDGRSASVLIERIEAKRYRVTVNGRARVVQLKDEQDLLLEEMGLDEVEASSEAEITAPMPGLVLDIRVEVGDTVQAGEGLVVVEAMKMENELSAPADGRVTAVHVATGDTVDKDQLLIEVEKAT